MLSLWQDLFSHDISPEALLVELAGGLHWFIHSNVLLLFWKDRVIYDCQIQRAAAYPYERRAWRDVEGYYTLEHDIAHPEEFLFPLGKAFLLCEKPWDAHKVI